MIVRSLERLPFEELVNCFLQSFEGYFVKMPTELAYYKSRWEAAKVDFSLSFGMFDNDKLIGFIINAIDTRNGSKIAYNAGTGVLPKFRGRKIVKSIYNKAIEELMNRGVVKCTLEVIVENEIAIRAYEGIGFQKIRTLKCYNGLLTFEQSHEIDLAELDIHKLDAKHLPNQEYCAWENHLDVAHRAGLRYFQLSNQNGFESYFIINEKNGFLAQFDLIQNSASNWERLFYAISTISQTVKIVNVDDRLIEKIVYLESLKLNNMVNQFEMELILH